MLHSSREGPVRAVRRVGRNRSTPRVPGEGDVLEFALSGRVLAAADVLRTGPVPRVVADPPAVADDVAEGAPDALRTTKERIRDRRDDATREAAEAAAFARLVEAHAPETRSNRSGTAGSHATDRIADPGDPEVSGPM